MTDRLDGERFFTTVDGARAATPLFVTLLLVDFADVVFAVDSIPAIFAVTQDPFLVFTSNAFAILGLRALYFAIICHDSNPQEIITQDNVSIDVSRGHITSIIGPATT